MIAFYLKTQKEIDEEIRKFPTHRKKLCLTYILKSDGTKIDTSSLSEEDIMTIIAQDVADFVSPTGSYKRTGNNNLASFNLLNTVKNKWVPSVDAILQTYYMEQIYGHIMSELRAKMDKYGIVEKASIIAKFQKESNGIFEEPTDTEIIAVLEQMNYNEKMKQQKNQGYNKNSRISL